MFTLVRKPRLLTKPSRQEWIVPTAWHSLVLLWLLLVTVVVTLLAKNLKGRLLICTGDIDNNVHPGNTIKLANALIKANKRFDFFNEI